MVVPGSRMVIDVVELDDGTIVKHKRELARGRDGEVVVSEEVIVSTGTFRALSLEPEGSAHLNLNYGPPPRPWEN